MKKQKHTPAKTETAAVVAVPTGYDPTKIEAGVLHIGLGNFAMAHICDIVHRLLQDEKNYKWGIVAASLRSGIMLNALRKQDHVYTLVEKKGTHRHAKVMAPIVDTIYAPEDPSKLVDKIADPNIKLVTMTISADGYCLANGNLNLSNPHVVHDMSDPTVPQTIYYYLAKGLAARAAVSDTPLVLMSLDNVQSNSRQLRKALLQYLEQTDATLVEWVETFCDFPVTLVDRITPEVKDEFRCEIRELLGVDPGVLIGTEKFWQLVCEYSRFELPPLEEVGVKMVESCAEYWPRKYFMLNTVHQVVGIVGMRLGVETIHHAMEHSALSRLAQRAHEEFRVFLAGEDDELAEYSSVILDRFADPSMNDSVVRVTKGTTKKVSERVLSTVELALAAGGEMPSASIFTAAAWLHNLSGCDQFAQPVAGDDVDSDRLAEIYHDFASELEVQARFDSDDRHKHGVKLVRAFLISAGTILGDSRFARLAAIEPFVYEFARWVLAIEEHGIETAIETLLDSEKDEKKAVA